MWAKEDFPFQIKKKKLQQQQKEENYTQYLLLAIYGKAKVWNFLLANNSVFAKHSTVTVRFIQNKSYAIWKKQKKSVLRAHIPFYT